MSKYQSKKQHAPIDDTVQVPAAIRAAALQAEEMHKRVYQQQQEEEEEQPKGAGANPEGDDVRDEGQNGQEKQEEQEGKVTPEGNQEVAEKPANDQQDKAPKSSSSENWEHKYNSLKGRYDRQTDTINHLTKRISDMEALISRMQEQPKQEETSPPAELTFKPIGQEERETFGEDFIDVAKRAAYEGLSPEVVRLNNEIKKLQAQLSNVMASTATQQKQTIYTYLDSQLDNWREINRNPDFIAWANLPDPFSGVTRIEMLREAFNKGDGPRVLNFFRGFLKDEAATDPVKPKPDTQKGKVPLEAFAAPGRAKAPAATPSVAPGEKETISRAQIAEFYRLKAQGYWRGNPEEERALEERIFAAEREGRIVN